jgi:hypothetical protein
MEPVKTQVPPLKAPRVVPSQAPLVLPLKALVLLLKVQVVRLKAPPVLPVARPLVPAVRPLVPAVRRTRPRPAGEWVVPEEERSAREARPRVRTACLSRRRSP